MLLINSTVLFNSIYYYTITIRKSAFRRSRNSNHKMMPITDKDVDAIVAKLSIRNSRGRQTSSSKKKRFVYSLYINL